MRRVRLVVVVAATVALTIGPAPTAQATTVGTVKFVGTFGLGPGIAAPCVGEAGGIDANKCTFTTSTKPTPGGKPGDTMLNVTAPNTAAVNLANVLCVANLATAGKPGKLPVETGLCTMTAAGAANGYCGLMTGTMTGAIKSLVPVTVVQQYNFFVKFTVLGDIMYFAGTVTKPATGDAGWIRGEVDLTPFSGSCTDKQAKVFLAQGEAAIKILT